jgi:hypothetical protein
MSADRETFRKDFPPDFWYMPGLHEASSKPRNSSKDPDFPGSNHENYAVKPSQV